MMRRTRTAAALVVASLAIAAPAAHARATCDEPVAAFVANSDRVACGDVVELNSSDGFWVFQTDWGTA